ncbi:MAG: TonB-dependent receptor [Nevskiaceae bacterium]|nr:TonB-dependent receptor [Nevskiaceae bacterium]
MTVGASVAAILGTAALATWSPTVSAAAASSDDGLAEVTVTGSRIQRRDFESNSPIISVESAALEERAGLNVEAYLNELPNFNPAASPVTSQGDVQITPVNSVGVATISLRGFGANRNLVLVDGHRAVPVNALLVTDTNGIPSSLVERVEIISGGASAVYGADAIGGVTNFILKKNFQGLEADIQYGITEVGDGEEVRAYTVFGTNFADNRGNVTMAMEYYNREAALERNRKFYTKSWSDPYVGSNDFFVFGWNEIGTGSVPNPNGPTVANNANLNTILGIFNNRPVYPAGGPGAGLQTSPCNFNLNAALLCNGAAFRINEDGSLFTLNGNLLDKFRQGGGVIDGVEYAIQYGYDGTISQRGQIRETLKYNDVDVMSSGPQDRYSIYAAGTFDITDNIQFFARGNWNQSTTRTRLFGTNATGGWAANIAYNPTTDSPLLPTLDWNDSALVAAAIADPTNPLYANPAFIPHMAPGAQHPVSVEAAALLNSRPNQAGDWIVGTYPVESFDARATLNTTAVWQVETGLNFDLPIKDWTAELYYSHGASSQYNNAFGNSSLSRWRVLVSQPDYGYNSTLESNQPNTVPAGTASTSLGFGGAIVNCTSGFYDMIFSGDARPSDDCRNAVIANLQTRTSNQQDVFELNLQGGLFDLWAGEVRGAAGFQYRRNQSQFIPDILQSTSSFLDQVIGVYPTGYLDVATSVKDIYGELLVPLVSDLPFLKRVELELGGRYSDYSDTDSTWTYKAVANVQFTDWLRMRGGYNRATRAPNLGELFLQEQEVFGAAGNFGDACSARSNAPYGAAISPRRNPDGTFVYDANGIAPTAIDPVPGANEVDPVMAAGQTEAGAISTYLICQAQMGATGRDAYYGNPVNGITGANAGGGGGGGFSWNLQVGNPNLLSEKADTWTAGLVFTSVSDNPWLARLTAAVDWWKVDIADAIQQYSVDYANYLCYGARIVTNEQEALEQANSEGCLKVPRNRANGTALTAMIGYDNQATISTSGVDVQVNWGGNLSDLGATAIPGDIGLNITTGFLNYYKTKTSPLPIDVETDWKGSLGPQLTGTNGGAYDYRINTSLSYRLNPISVSLRWRFLPSVWGGGIASQKAIIENNERVAAGGEGMMLSYTPSTAIKTSSYNAFDLSFNWTISDILSLRAGINNLFDKQPALTGRSTGRPFDPTKTDAQNVADQLSNVCSADALTKGCQNPTGFSLPNPGYGGTSAGYYDTLGRRYFIGIKARL